MCHGEAVLACGAVYYPSFNPVVVFIMQQKVILTFGFLGEKQNSEHSNE